MNRVSIVGGSGYAGGDLLRVLLFHPEVEVVQVTSERFAGKFVSTVHPNLRKLTKLKFVTIGELESCDTLFLCLPHGHTMQRIDEFEAQAKTIIDLSADFRLNDSAHYEKWYGKPHGCPERLSDFVYGIPELHRSSMVGATRIASAGINRGIPAHTDECPMEGYQFYADLHVHSKYSRATSRNCDLEHMAFWARKKGVSVLATGDFTHPAWFEEIQAKLVPGEPGLYRLRPDLERQVDEWLGGAAGTPVRFMLQVEISTIYKKDDRTRKVHHLIYVPDLAKAQKVRESLDRIGNIRSDGRPILGLDSRDLLEITLEAGEGCYLIPAHIWTPWFAVLGSKSGFDEIEHCYGELTPHIFALETGLSSDPPMNWRLSGLDRYSLVSNSDAHSPPKIAREACVFDTEMDYFAMRRALETGEVVYTV